MWPVRGFIVGVVVTLLLIVIGGYLFVRSGGVSLATTGTTLSDTERWQVTLLLQEADKLPAAVQTALANPAPPVIPAAPAFH